MGLTSLLWIGCALYWLFREDTPFTGGLFEVGVESGSGDGAGDASYHVLVGGLGSE